MTPKQFELALGYLMAAGLRLPHGIFPGLEPGGVRAFPAAKDWAFYQWNPPEYLVGQAGFDECQEADRDASAKPTWAAIEAAHAIAAPPALREQRQGELRAECRRRITAAYGAADWQDEIEKRAGGRVSAEQDAERDRLRATHAALTAALAGMTLGELEAFKPADDTNWAANDDHEEENDGS